ncbi:MAG: hypothetical protein ACFFAV_16840 [Candidatus Hermodarchaeota archaeon]
MRKTPKILIIVLALLIGGGTGVFFIVGFATLGTIDESFTFHYQAVPSSIEELNLDIGIGAIDIRYNTSNTPYIVRIDVDMRLSGLFMSGMGYADFFGPPTSWWQNGTFPPILFRLRQLPHLWLNPASWFKLAHIEINVTLRNDVIYNINAGSGTGSIRLVTPSNVILDDVDLGSGTGSIYMSVSENTTIQEKVNLDAGTGSISLYGKNTNFTNGLLLDAGTGSIIANLSNSVIGGNIGLSSGTGSIDFRIYHTEYTQNCNWAISAGTGGIFVGINQHGLMGANVTGNINTGTGTINLQYIDTSSSVGASFFGSTGTGSFNRVNTLGFIPGSNPFNSLDFPTTYNYDLNLDTGTGNINVDGSST